MMGYRIHDAFINTPAPAGKSIKTPDILPVWQISADKINHRRYGTDHYYGIQKIIDNTN